MRRFLAALVAVLLLAPQASAQTAATPHPAPLPPPPAIAAQVGAASVETSYLLALYMAELANAGTPPSQSDIDEATRQYLTNGAAVTGVPGSGPASAYFQNGAAVMGIPSSGPGAAYFHNGAEVLAYPSPRAAGTVAPATQPGGETGPTAVGIMPAPEDAGALDAAEEAETGLTPVQVLPVGSGISPVPTAPAESPPNPATTAPSPAPSPAPSCAPCIASSPEVVRVTSALPAEPAPTCPPGPSQLTRLATALGGVLFGGLAVVLWTRPRPPPSKKRAAAK
jgi:hypothetical protein